MSRVEQLAVQRWSCDVSDMASCQRVLESIQPHAIFHLAGDSAVRHWDAQFSGVTKSFEHNLLPTLNVVIAAATASLPSLQLLVRSGGLEEYGTGPQPYEEHQREQPVSPYSASQVAATHYLQMLSPRLPFRTVTVRPALVYGPAQRRNFLIPDLILSCLEHRDFDLRAGSHSRDLLFVDDLIDAMLRLLEYDVPTGEVVNICTGHEHRMRDVAELIVELTNAPISIRDSAPVATATGSLEHLVGSPARARQVLNWEPRTALRDGLEKTIASYRASYHASTGRASA